MKTQNPDIDTSAIKVDVPKIKPPSKPKVRHPLPAIAPPVPAGFPALHPPAYAPGPRPGHNPVGGYPPQVAAPPQFPQIAAPAGLPANPHVNIQPWPAVAPLAAPAPFQVPQIRIPAANPHLNVQWQPVLVPPAPVVPAGRQGRANRHRDQNPQVQRQPKGRQPARARR